MQKEELSSLNNFYDFTFIGGEKNIYSFLTSSQITHEVHFKPTPYLFGEDSEYSAFTYEFS